MIYINIKTVKDHEYKFVYSFDLDSGFYLRTGIINGKGVDTGIDPFMGSFPHLLDIGIMGHCEHGKSGLCIKSGVECYQDGLSKYQDNMKLDDYKRIVDECEGKLFQIALGGRGDPDMHENIEAILSYTRGKNIIPNMTTSGYGLTEETAKLIKKYCGAVAVSWYRSRQTIDAIELLIKHDIKTNIHFVLSNNSIDEAYSMIANDKIPKGINKVIFLLHKPIGLGSSENVLQFGDKRIEDFFELFNSEENSLKAGFDSCSVPGLINYSKNVHLSSIDTCEAARFSAYISPDMNMTPCSFDQDYKWSNDLDKCSVKDVWESETFNNFRSVLKNRCKTCDTKSHCLGGCPIKKEIVLCDRLEVNDFED